MLPKFFKKMKLINAYYEFINLPYNSYPRNIVAISFTRATGISSARYIFFSLPFFFAFVGLYSFSGADRTGWDGARAHGTGIKGRIIRVPSAVRDLVPQETYHM